MKKNWGFTLLEIMVILAIIGILATLGFPAYQNYIIRSRVIDGLNVLHSYKVPLTEYYVLNGVLPTTVDQFPDPTPRLNDTMSEITFDFTADRTWIYLAFQGDSMGDVATKKLALVAEKESGRDGLLWTCTTDETDAIDFKYLPKSCKTYTEYIPEE